MPRWLVEKAGVQITILPEGDAVTALILPMLTDLQARSDACAADIEITVAGAAGAWHLREPANNVERNFKNPGDLIYHLSDRIVFHIADRAASAHCLHAAAVEDSGQAVVIPGNSGAGKSSFTAWLVANGFDYLTDELILLEAGNVSGVARPIQIKQSGIDAIRPLLIAPDAFIEGRQANAVFPSDLGGEVSPRHASQLAAIVYPHYQANAEFNFTTMSRAEAGMSLMETHVNARNLEGHGFRKAMRQIRLTRCYRLEYGSFDQLADGFSDRLRAILAGRQ